MLGLGNLDAPAAAAAKNGVLHGTTGTAVFVGDILRAKGIPVADVEQKVREIGKQKPKKDKEGKAEQQSRKQNHDKQPGGQYFTE